MRILFANPIGGLGGAELFLLEMLQELRARAPDWDLHLICGGEGPLIAQANELGVTCHLLPFPQPIAATGDSSASRRRSWLGSSWRIASSVSVVPGYVRRFRRLVREIEPDVIHSNGLKFHVLTGLAGIRRTRLTWFMHDYLGSRHLARRLLPRLAGPVDFIWANSESVAIDVHRVIPSKPVRVLHCGIDLDHFTPGPGDAAWLDRQCGTEPQAPGLRIGLVATFARWKGQDVFLEAAAELIRRISEPVAFYVIGGPIYHTAGSQFAESELRELSRRLGIAPLVQFCPFQNDVARVYRTLDIVVHASRQPEPFGRTILEAMACGRPVVATQAGGAAEIFHPDYDAIGVQPGNAAGLADALERLVRDSALRIRLASQARRSAMRFSRGRMGERLYDAYRTIGETHRTSRELVATH